MPPTNSEGTTKKSPKKEQVIMVRLIDGTKTQFTNIGGFSTYEDLWKELQGLKNISVMLADVTKLEYSNS